ncbi:hypothetical protein AN700_0228145 [Klebsiella michiganensis]|nr:hypothetical protein AN700_0228145 [Klebsiella michiganensis]
MASFDGCPEVFHALRHRRLPVGWRAQGAPAVQLGQIDPGVINAAVMMVKTVGGEVGGEDRDLRSGTRSHNDQL